MASTSEYSSRNHSIHLFLKTARLVHCSVPKGLEDVSKYPVLFAELLGVGWTVEELTKLAGANLLRVLNEVESIRDKMREAGVAPYEDIITGRGEDPYNCTTS